MVELPSATEALQLLATGRIDAAALTLDEAISAKERGVDIRIVLVIDFSNGADVLLARPEITSLADLKGKSIAVEATAVGAILLSGALASAGLLLSDIELIPATADQHYSVYSSGQADAVVTFEPKRTKLMKSGAIELFSSRDIPSQIVDVLAVRTDAMESSPQAIRQLLNGYFSALDYLQTRPQDAIRRMAPRLAISPDELLSAYNSLQLLGLEENRKLLGGSPAPATALAEKIMTTMKKHKLLQSKVATTKLFTDGFLK